MIPDLENAALVGMSEEALLLREMSRRAAVEAAAAAAVIGLALSHRSRSRRDRLLVLAMDRLHGLAELNRLLARPPMHRVELASDVTALAVAMTHGRGVWRSYRIALDLSPTWMAGVSARRMLVVAAGFVHEVLSTRSHSGSNRLGIALRAEEGTVTLSIEDDGRGLRLEAPGIGAAVGRGVAGELVGRSGGTITLVTGPGGTCVTIAMPSGLPDGDEVPF